MANKERFMEVFTKNITRPGADKLLDFIEKTSFFTDPASTKYHMCYEGGLCTHSLNVFDRMMQLAALRKQETNNSAATYLSDESCAIVSLLHDLCKAGVYVQDFKNKKTYDPEIVQNYPRYSVKHDAGGDYVWETVKGYSFQDPFPYGHGEKSVYLIQKYMQLTDEEAMAIRYHMSTWQENDNKNTISQIYNMNSLAFLLHTADELATFLDESGNGTI